MKHTVEIIAQVVLNENAELLLKLESEGHPHYQYVYREAAGVYWDQSQKAFKSTPTNRHFEPWSCTEWYAHIVSVVTCIGVKLVLSEHATFKNLPEEDKNGIINLSH